MTRQFLLCVLLIFWSCVSLSAAEWRGITPLHSSKTDVVRLLGNPKTEGKYVSSYEFENEFVDVYYASGPPCGDGLTNGWRVPRDIVTSIRVTPKIELTLDSVAKDLIGYRRSTDPTNVKRAYYVDDERGVHYTVRVDSQASIQYVMSVDYLPTRNDDRLRCFANRSLGDTSGFPPFETYGSVSLTKRNTILDNFAIQLERDKELKGIIVAYTTRQTRAHVALRLAQSARKYLLVTRRVKSNRIVAMAGGRREEVMVELYLVPRGAAAPSR